LAYDSQFFAAQAPGSNRSAERIVPLVIDALHPKAVIDVGCGIGTWLAAFRAHGVVDVVGLDGDYVDRSRLQIPEESFRAVDLTQPLLGERRYDLAVCLEVGEHLPRARSESLVADLVARAPAVLFSAAIPLQGGTDHINERWQDEWVSIFETHGYRAVDLVRPAVWNDEDVDPWYAQNAILYVAADVSVSMRASFPWRVVHPRMFTQRVEQERGRLRSLGEVAREIPGAARRWLELVGQR
jgi:SAM-dependent methyltransferase